MVCLTASWQLGSAEAAMAAAGRWRRAWPPPKAVHTSTVLTLTLTLTLTSRFFTRQRARRLFWIAGPLRGPDAASRAPLPHVPCPPAVRGLRHVHVHLRSRPWCPWRPLMISDGWPAVSTRQCMPPQGCLGCGCAAVGHRVHRSGLHVPRQRRTWRVGAFDPLQTPACLPLHCCCRPVKASTGRAGTRPPPERYRVWFRCGQPACCPFVCSFVCVLVLTCCRSLRQRPLSSSASMYVPHAKCVW